MPVFDLKLADFEILDGTTPTPKSIVLRLGEGTLSYSEKTPRMYKKNRGKLYSVLNGEEEPVDVNFSFIWEYLKADVGLPPSVEDVLYQRGEAVNWVTTDADPCAPYAVDIRITFNAGCLSQKKEVILLPDFRVEDIDHDAKDATCTCTGKCNTTRAIITRVV